MQSASPSDVPDIVRLAKALNDEGVRWVLIGGLAVFIHGGNHPTADCDVVFSSATDNLEALKRALVSIHAQPKRSSSGWDELDLSVLLAPFMHLRSDAGDIDLINRLPGVDSFDGLYQRSVTVSISGTPIRVASIDDLISLKSDSTRDRDREHVRELHALKSLTGE